MNQVGAYEATTHLPELLEKVSRGKKIIITQHGMPIAILCPYDEKKRYATVSMIETVKQFRKNKKLHGLNVKAMIETGRD